MALERTVYLKPVTRTGELCEEACICPPRFVLEFLVHRLTVPIFVLVPMTPDGTELPCPRTK